MLINSEYDFQKWLARHLAQGHYQDHRLSALPHVPDLSFAMDGVDFWLELKFDRFRLGHDRYDDFKFREYKPGQSMWLYERGTYGKAVCGYLGYVQTFGDDPSRSVDYLCFLTPTWYKKYEKQTVGALLLSKHTTAFADVTSARLLTEFILTAWSLQRL